LIQGTPAGISEQGIDETDTKRIEKDLNKRKLHAFTISNTP
jgi:hypothetical protein